ncbi:hypothetical protein BVY04_02220 [bacterium M21]|nr:hypothetical protein BVY04_02220 [bacterium M21]
MKRFLLTCIFTILCGLITQAQAAPQDMTLSGEQAERARISKKYINAPPSPKEKQLKALIKKLQSPIKKGEQITIRWNTRIGWKTLTGKLHSVYNGKARIGSESVVYSLMAEDDRLRFEKWFPFQKATGSKVDPWKKRIEELGKELKKERARSIGIKVDAAMNILGYTAKFYDDVVVIGDQYIPRNELKRNKNFQLRIKEYGKGSGPGREGVISLEMVNKTQLRSAAVLVVEHPTKPGELIPLLSSKSVGSGDKVAERGWADAKGQINTKDFGVLARKMSKLIREKSHILLLKRDLVMWQVDCVPTRGGRETRSSIIECRSCLGRKVVPPITGVDIRTEAEALLKESAAGPSYREAVEELIIECAKPPKGAKELPCPTCEGEGEESVNRYSSRTSMINFTMELPARALPEPDQPMNATCPRMKPISPDQIKTFEKLFLGVPNQDSIEKQRMEGAKGYKGKREEAIRNEYMQKIEEVLETFLGERKQRMYALLEERFEWLTAKQMLEDKSPKAPGAQKVLLVTGEDDGYLPTTVLGKTVRRYTEWEKLNTRPDTKLGGYSLLTTYYRILEVGGEPIVEEKVEETTKRMSPRERRRQMLMDERRLMEEGQDAEDAEDEEEKEEEPEVPVDLMQRSYVLQVAVSFRSAMGKGYLVNINGKVELTAVIDPDEKINFPLNKEEAAGLAINHTFKVPANWSGYLIGSTPLTFKQMISDYERSAFKFTNTIK